MTRGVAALSVLVLTEDTASDARTTLEALARKIFLLIDPSCQTHRIRFEPPESEAVQRALRGNLWKSAEPRDQNDRRALIGYIATKLLEGPRSFVLFHIDGDRPWSEREQSENVTKFGQFIERDVRQFIEHRRQLALAAGPRRGIVGGELVPALDQLIRVTPHYSIEAWLFQNATVALRLCAEHPSCRGAHADLIRAWQDDRGLLDEISKPKDALCFGATQNAALAQSGFPTEEVYRAGKSFEETVNRALECTNLVAALRATWEATPPGSEPS